MNTKLAQAIRAGSTAPTTPDSDNPSLTLVDCIEGAPQNWSERARFRPIMRSRASKPKSRHANKLDKYAQIRRRTDPGHKGAVDSGPSVLGIMRRSGYIVKREG